MNEAMKQFQARLKVNNESAVLLFTLMYTTSGDMFYVTVTFRKAVSSFTMTKSEKGNWEIIGPVADWIKRSEELISDVIKENLK